MMGEAELMVRFAAGEPAGVAETYRRYGRLVYTVSHRVLDDPGLAEEATKQTFVRAWRVAATLVPGQAMAPLLASIASRTAMKINRTNIKPRSSQADRTRDIRIGRPQPGGPSAHASR